MEKVLFITYHFPPESDAGVHRSINFARMLPEFGYQPVVLTVDTSELERRGCKIDEALLEKVPADTIVLRAPSHFNYDKRDRLMQKRLFRFAWMFNYKKWWESAAGWIDPAYEIAKKAIAEHNIKTVYTSSAPFATMELAIRLKNELGVNWVADCRDPFTDAYANRFPTRFHWNSRRKWEARTFCQADMLVVNTPEVKKLYLKRKLTTPEKIEVLTNGYLNV